MDKKDEPVVSIVAGEAAPSSDPPPPETPADPPPPDEPPPETPADPPPPDDETPPADQPPDGAPLDDAQLPAELPNGFAELYVPTLTEMADQLAGELDLDRAVARERIELAARAMHEFYHLPRDLALSMLQRMPTLARTVLFAQTAHEQAVVASYLQPVPDLD